MTNELRAGDTVQVIERFQREIINQYQMMTFSPGIDYEIRRITTNMVILRDNDRGTSAYVEKTLLDGMVASADGKRRLGQVPEDGGDYIAPNDPRLKWLWDDAAEYARQQGYCPTYDAICARLGIPGRPRDYEVTGMLDGLGVTTKVKAHSGSEAIEMVLAKIAGLTGTRALVTD